MTPDSFGNYPNAEILERRVLVGFHNGLHFIHTPIVTTLHPEFDDEIGDGFDLVFNGRLELDKYAKDGADGMAVVFIVEYKVCILTNQPASPKKSGFGAILEKISGPSPNTMEIKNVDVEKDVCIGWGYCSPENVGSKLKRSFENEDFIDLSLSRRSYNQAKL